MIRVLVDGARSADPPISHGRFLATALSTLPDDSRRSDSLGVGGEGGKVLVPTVRKLPVLNPVKLVGKFRILGLIVLDPREPGVAKLLAALADPLAKELMNAVGNQELRVLRPTVEFLREPDFVLTQRLAVRGAGVLLVGCPPGDVAIDDNQGRPIAAVEKRLVSARSSRPRSLASPTRTTFQP